MKAKIFDIKRFAVHDGDGIRTTLFFKGCPLKCVWCHNPEGIAYTNQLAYYDSKCICCGECAKVCPEESHSIGKDGHTHKRELCKACGICEATCPGEALKLYGRDITVTEALELLTEDKDFYESSGGGITLSGGECLMQPDFCRELLKAVKTQGIHTAVDTCGYVPREAIDKVMPYTDIFLYDLKAYDEDVHTRCTGKPNGLILDNLKYIDSCNKPIEIRIPYVPGYNDNQTKAMAGFLSGLNNITKIRILPYHNYAGSKYASLNMANTLPGVLPSDDKIKLEEELFKSYNLPILNNR